VFFICHDIGVNVYIRLSEPPLRKFTMSSSTHMDPDRRPILTPHRVSRLAVEACICGVSGALEFSERLGSGVLRAV